jgi:hypothetical protein
MASRIQFRRQRKWAPPPYEIDSKMLESNEFVSRVDLHPRCRYPVVGVERGNEDFKVAQNVQGGWKEEVAPSSSVKSTKILSPTISCRASSHSHDISTFSTAGTWPWNNCRRSQRGYAQSALRSMQGHNIDYVQPFTHALFASSGHVWRECKLPNMPLLYFIVWSWDLSWTCIIWAPGWTAKAERSTKTCSRKKSSENPFSHDMLNAKIYSLCWICFPLFYLETLIMWLVLVW